MTDIRTNQHKWHINTWLIISLVILNLADYQTTAIIIAGGGGEANPFLNWLIEASGTVWSILWFDIFALSILIIPYMLVAEYRKRVQANDMFVVLIILNIIYLTVVIRSSVAIWTHLM